MFYFTCKIKTCTHLKNKLLNKINVSAAHLLFLCYWVQYLVSMLPASSLINVTFIKPQNCTEFQAFVLGSTDLTARIASTLVGLPWHDVGFHDEGSKCDPPHR